MTPDSRFYRRRTGTVLICLGVLSALVMADLQTEESISLDAEGTAAEAGQFELENAILTGVKGAALFDIWDFVIFTPSWSVAPMGAASQQSPRVSAASRSRPYIA